ncbi:hypothetical protein C8F04DRAFT_1077000 [Mycena alexandri]|uniref:Uncharacterized protein n=1 Tax=Mycena alexandri TaxID=1745969 RepID=A0AAD6T9E3_9AGAR|nr:hypothetical protein C8F04DRAFT_1077000 [Mycena alexandri]
MKLEPFPEAKPKIETEFKPFSRGVKFESAEEKGFQVNDNLHRATENDRKEFGSLKIKTKSEGISSFVKVEENADVKIACKLETSKIEPKTERISVRDTLARLVYSCMTFQTASLKVDGDTIGTFKIERKPDGVSSDKAEDEASPFMLPSQGLAVDEVLPMPMEVDRDGGRAVRDPS